MCIFCDLNKTEDNRNLSARNYAQDIIDTCNSIAGGYKAVLSGHIKPHTDRMADVVRDERHLIRLIIDDVL